MAEIVTGVGHQKSIRSIVSISETELRKKRGVPRRVTGHADSMSFEAERASYDTDFEVFTIHVKASGKLADTLTRAAEKLGDLCAHSTDDGIHTFVCPAPSSTDYVAGRRALDELCSQLTLPEIWRFDGEKYRIEPISMEVLFRAMLQYKASDIHLTPGQTPIFRVDNQTHSADIIGEVSAAQILDLVKLIAPERNWEQFQRAKQTSFNYHQSGLGYARASAFLKSGTPHLTIRYLPEKIPSFEELHVPAPLMQEMSELHDGLLLIAGMTGSGKTTTAAALVDWINRHRMCHILTIEDPVEYVHANKKAFVSQRSLGEDVTSFSVGVEGALRQDPDVILIGEMRDADTIRAAINAASTGHLLISTLHSTNAFGVVNRIISFFDPVERDLVRQQLQDSLRAVICQRLIPRKGGGRVPALEFLFNDTAAISKGMKAGDTIAIRIGMQQTLSHSMLFEHHIFEMYEEGLITLETAKAAAPELGMFEQILMGTYSVPRVL